MAIGVETLSPAIHVAVMRVILLNMVLDHRIEDNKTTHGWGSSINAPI